MDEFLKEIKQTPTFELGLILKDQQELYSEEELNLIEEELNSREDYKNGNYSDSIEQVLKEIATKEAEAKKIEQERLKKERIEKEIQAAKEAFELKIQNLRNMGHTSYFEYKVININDSFGGALNKAHLEDILNLYALDGWRVRNSFSNELGSNRFSTDIKGFTAGFNSTMDEHIIILEREIKI